MSDPMTGERKRMREPGTCVVDIASGELTGATNRYAKTLADLAGVYEDEAAYRAMLEKMAGTVVYEVTSYTPSNDAGDMIIGVTRMLPGKIGREFFVTRGHIHARANRPEMYYGESGRGVLLLESPGGDIRTVAFGPRSVCYVPPFWIHRTVNVGPDPLVMTFAYPADSGQDYDIIVKSGGMRSRVVDDGKGGWTVADNAAYRPRSAETVAAILAQTE
jgi:glucose-6-phosphate isomerase, archaeal